MRRVNHSRDTIYVTCDHCRREITTTIYYLEINKVALQIYGYTVNPENRREYCSIYCAMAARQTYIRIVPGGDPLSRGY